MDEISQNELQAMNKDLLKHKVQLVLVWSTIEMKDRTHVLDWDMLSRGELELIFLNSHAPDSIHRTLSSGRLELPYCRLAIVPNLEPDICGCCACVIDIMLDDVNLTTTAATTIIIGSLVTNVCLLLGVTKK